jgi:hypothetical protein
MSATGPFISDAARDRLRALALRSMTGRCDIVRYTPGPPNPDNSPGDQIEQRQSGIPCRYSEGLLRGVETLVELRLTGEARYSLRLPLGTDVTTADVIEYAGRRYEIAADNIGRTQTTSINLTLRLLV